jgi:WD40 repeat protein
MRLLHNTAKGLVTALAFLPDGRLLAAGSGSFELHPLAGGPVVSVPTFRGANLVGLAIDQRRGWLYCSFHDRRFRVFRLDGTSRDLSGPEDKSVVALAVSPDGGRLVISRGTGPIYGGRPNRLECWLVEGWDDWRLAWTIDETQPEKNPWRFHFSAAIPPDGGSVAVVGRRHLGHDSLALRDLATGALLRETELKAYWARPHLRFTTDARRLVLLEESQLTLWEVDGLREASATHAPGRGHFRSLAMHPSGRFFATTAGDGVVRYWHPGPLRELRQFKWDIGKLSALAFSPDGMLGAVGGEKGCIAVWDVDD